MQNLCQINVFSMFWPKRSAKGRQKVGKRSAKGRQKVGQRSGKGWGGGSANGRQIIGPGLVGLQPLFDVHFSHAPLLLDKTVRFRKSEESSRSCPQVLHRPQTPSLRAEPLLRPPSLACQSGEDLEPSFCPSFWQVLAPVQGRQRCFLDCHFSAAAFCSLREKKAPLLTCCAPFGTHSCSPSNLGQPCQKQGRLENVCTLFHISLVDCGCFVLCQVSGGGSGVKWKEVHQSIRDELPVPTPTWTATHSLLGMGSSARVLDLVNVTYSRYHANLVANHHAKTLGLDEGECAACSLYLDVSQDARRSCFADSSVRSICGGSTFYSYKEDRMICPAEHLCLLGWSRSAVESLPASLTPAMLRDLAGESMACPCVALALSTLLLSMAGDVWEQP